MPTIEELKYPIGKYISQENISDEHNQKWIHEIEILPQRLKNLVENFSVLQLDTRYRPDGWTVRQVVHHIADSHMNAYIRFHLMLTEENPAIRPYKENLWAELSYLKNLDINFSLNIITTLHARWVLLLKSINKNDYAKTYFHPQYSKNVSIPNAIGTYAWHGNHHFAQIAKLKERNFIT